VTLPARASGVLFAAGFLVKATSGLARAAMYGTRSIRVGYVPPAFCGGLKRNASRVLGGRLTRIGMRHELSQAIHNPEA
jgi:hypothetical protein